MPFQIKMPAILLLHHQVNFSLFCALLSAVLKISPGNSPCGIRLAIGLPAILVPLEKSALPQSNVIPGERRSDFHLFLNECYSPLFLLSTQCISKCIFFCRLLEPGRKSLKMTSKVCGDSKDPCSRYFFPFFSDLNFCFCATRLILLKECPCEQEMTREKVH